MAVKTVIFVCAQALLLQSISAQCIGAGLAAPWTYDAWNTAPYAGAWAGAPCGAAGIYGAELLAPAAAAASHGGGLPIASASALPPSGVSVASENAYAGELAVRGALPFLGTVGLEGALPTAGAAAVAYNCGNGQVGMLTEDIGAAGIAGPLAYGAGIGALGYEAPLLGRAGCGYGRAAFI